MIERLDSEDFRDLFGPWFNKFKPFIESKEMFDIYQRLKSEKIKVVPNSQDVFNTFKFSYPENLNTIWYLLDPYPRRYNGRKSPLQATGVALDCSNSPDGKLQPSLEKFYEGIDKDLNIKCDRSPDVKYLLEQGVLLLNTDLTCLIQRTGSHEGLWEPFQKFFLEEVMRGTKDVIYVLCGKESKKMKKFINPLGNTIIELDHPSYAARNHTDWNTKKVFSTINKLLKENKGYEIDWNKADYMKDLPF